MTTLVTDHDVLAVAIAFTEQAMQVSLDDGRMISVPLAWYPRLLNATSSERMQFELIGDGEGIHWPALDEDISIESLVAGRRSAESPASLARWMQRRQVS